MSSKGTKNTHTDVWCGRCIELEKIKAKPPGTRCPNTDVPRRNFKCLNLVAVSFFGSNILCADFFTSVCAFLLNIFPHVQSYHYSDRSNRRRRHHRIRWHGSIGRVVIKTVMMVIVMVMTTAERWWRDVLAGRWTTAAGWRRDVRLRGGRRSHEYGAAIRRRRCFVGTKSLRTVIINISVDVW